MIELIKNKILTLSLKLLSSSGFVSKKLRHFINKAKFNQRKTIIYDIPYIDKRYVNLIIIIFFRLRMFVISKFLINKMKRFLFKMMSMRI